MLRVQGRELLSVGTCCSVIARLRLWLRLLTSWDLRGSGESAVDGVIQECSDVVNEEGVKQFGNLFLVGEFESTLKGNPGVRLLASIALNSAKRRSPNAFQMHWANLDYMLLLLALQNTVTSTTGHTSNIQKLSSVDHMIVFSNQ